MGDDFLDGTIVDGLRLDHDNAADRASIGGVVGDLRKIATVMHGMMVGTIPSSREEVQSLYQWLQEVSEGTRNPMVNDAVDHVYKAFNREARQHHLSEARGRLLLYFLDLA